MNLPKGFTDQISSPRILRVAADGHKGAGKTRLLVTAPDPVGILPLDINTRMTIAKVKAEFPKKQIWMPPEDLLVVAGLERINSVLRAEKWSRFEGLVADKIGAEEQKKRDEITRSEMRLYRDHLSRVKDLYSTLINNPDVRTVCIDTGTNLNDLVANAHYGKNFRVPTRDRGPFNLDMEEFWDLPGNRKHLIITHYTTEVWSPDTVDQSGRTVNGKPTGQWRLDGWKHTKFKANVCLHHGKAQTAVDLRKLEKEMGLDQGDLPSPTFYLRVYDSNANPELVSEGTVLVNDDVTFQNVAMMVYPDSRYTDWT